MIVLHSSDRKSEVIDELQCGVRDVCGAFPDDYWREPEPKRYPTKFVQALTEHGWFAAPIPEAYGEPVLGFAAAVAIMKEIAASRANQSACRSRIHLMSMLVPHESSEQRSAYLPDLATGALNLQASSVTEPVAGSDPTRASRTRVGYTIRRQKVFTSRAEHSDLMVLLARTSEQDDDRPTDGLPLFLIDLRKAGSTISIRNIPAMGNHATPEVFIDDLAVAADALIWASYTDEELVVLHTTGGCRPEPSSEANETHVECI